jgi:hypothetical protein
MSKIKELLNANSVTLFHDYRLGHANDLSKNANNGVLAGTKKFIHGGIIDPGVSGYVSVPKQLFFNAATFVFVGAWMPFKTINNSPSQEFIYEDGSYNSIQSNGSNIFIEVLIPPTFPEAHAVISGKTLMTAFAISYTDGATPKFYKNGVYVAMSNHYTHSTDIVTGVKLLGSSVYVVNSLVKSVFCTNTQLTDAEVAKVTSELIRQEY